MLPARVQRFCFAQDEPSTAVACTDRVIRMVGSLDGHAEAHRRFGRLRYRIHPETSLTHPRAESAGG